MDCEGASVVTYSKSEYKVSQNNRERLSTLVTEVVEAVMNFAKVQIRSNK